MAAGDSVASSAGDAAPSRLNHRRRAERFAFCWRRCLDFGITLLLYAQHQRPSPSAKAGAPA